MKNLYNKIKANLVGNKRKVIAAFTLIELLVSVGIFGFMTALMVAKYGNFNQSVLLTNLAYDVAVTIRTAQAYGLSVKSVNTVADEDKFKNAYGVYFNSQMGENDSFTLFTDINTKDGQYDGPSSGEEVTKYNLKRGATIHSVCATNNSICDPDEGTLNISFLRPDPSAQICLNSSNDTNDGCGFSYAEIIIKGSDDSMRVVRVRENGQISVGE